MKKRKSFGSADTILILLIVACLALAVMLAIANPSFLIPVLAIVLVVLVVLAIFMQRIRRLLKRLLGGRAAGGQIPGGLATFSVPVVALSDGMVIWYNDAFVNHICGTDAGLVPLTHLMPAFDPGQAAQPVGQDLALNGRRYTAYGNELKADKNIFFVIFVEDTDLKVRAEEYYYCRPSVMYFVIDTYDEILKEMRESDRAAIMTAIDIALENFVGQSSGFLRRVSSSRYMAVVEERHILELVAKRFSVLDDVRKLDEGGTTVTLSIGVGRMGTTLKECEEWAQQALDMALGRGGDQAAVKSPDGFEFYGGVSRSVEKRTKVKSRIVATAIKDLMANYDRVLVMGHKNSDMDSVGAAVGMLRFCRICNMPSAIVIDSATSMAGTLVDMLQKNGYGPDMMTPAEALPLTGPRTMCIVVDTHLHYLLESDEVYRSCGGKVVIDHHRRMVGHIEDAFVFYHEPYASSASELVSELLQYVGEHKNDKPTPVEASALLAGITLDTRTFALHVGVRTFEAAAWLRRMGAETEAVKKLFASTMNEFLYRSHLVSEAKVYEGVAVALSDQVPLECEVVAPQAANELLAIEGVDASVVGILVNGEVRLSARSMGDVNVQLIMEKVGGGGHLTMAGAQLKGISLEQADEQLKAAICAYMAERTDVAQAAK